MSGNRNEIVLAHGGLTTEQILTALLAVCRAIGRIKGAIPLKVVQTIVHDDAVQHSFVLAPAMTSSPYSGAFRISAQEDSGEPSQNFLRAETRHSIIRFTFQDAESAVAQGELMDIFNSYRLTTIVEMFGSMIVQEGGRLHIKQLAA